MPGGVIPFLGIFEPVSALIHLGAALVVLLSAPRLLRLGGTRRRIVALGAFVLAAALLLGLSGVYHSLPPGPARDMAQRFDHGAIWTLIVGTFTPIVVVILRGRLRSLTIILIWTIAIAGVVLKTVFFHEISEWVGLVFYVGLGWMGALSCVGLARQAGWSTVALCLAGGISYTVGAVLEFARTPIVIVGVLGPHEVFHIAIVLGVALHWVLLATLMRRVSLPVRTAARAVPWWDERSRRWATVSQ